MIEILKSIPFFSSLGEEDLKAISTTVQMDYLPKDHVVFSQGDPGDNMYIIKRGKVQVIREGAILAELSDGAFFGEMALVSDEPRNATVQTLTDVEVLKLGKEDFNKLVSSNENIASMVSYEVVKRANTL